MALLKAGNTTTFLNDEKKLIFLDQILTSIFNFTLVVLLSHGYPGNVADYGLAFSFALIVVGVYKNCALTPFITLGGQSLTELISYIKLASRSKYVISPILGLICATLYFGITLEILPIVIYFSILEMLKVYSISTTKINDSILYFIASYIIILSTVYFIPYYFSFTLGLLPLTALIVDTIRKEAVINKLVKPMDDLSAFLLTLTFSIYSHGPLWFLYTFLPELAPLFVQLRSLFQPLLVCARAADLIEKKSAAKNSKYNIERVKRIIWVYLLVCIPIILLLLLVSSFLFEILYLTPFGLDVLFAAILLGLINLLTAISKPLETYFFLKQKLKIIAKTRIIASVIFILTVPIVLYLPSHQFFYLLLLVNMCWFFINIINFYQIKKLIQL